MTAATKAQKCDRCGRRLRRGDGWNVDMVAGMKVGLICPDCQTPEESLGAEVNLVLSNYVGVKPTDDDFLTTLVTGLVQTYPTSEVMLAKADKLTTARKDPQASEMARLMRRLAAEMVSGELWED